MVMTLAPEPVVGVGRRPSAVVWIDGRHALVARTGSGGTISTRDVDRDSEPEMTYLARVVDEIGDRERVMILGPGSDRLALEREYVAVYHRPERLVDVEPAEAIEAPDLIDRLLVLAA